MGLENDDIADYIESLRACELLDGVELKFIKESKIDGVLLRSFELGALIRTGADARGLVKPIEPLAIPDIPSPEHIVPQTPVFLPPSKPIQKEGVEGEEAGEAGEVEINLGSMPSVSGFFEAPVFGPSASESKWSSPSGLFDLMGAAARTGERVRSEKAAQDAQSPSIEDEDMLPAGDPAAEESEPAPTGEPATKPMWFTQPVTGDDSAGDAGDGDETSTTGDDDSNEGDEPAPAAGDDQGDE